MFGPVQILRLFPWITTALVAGVLSACQPHSAPENGAAAETKAETYEEQRGDGMGGGMGDY